MDILEYRIVCLESAAVTSPCDLVAKCFEKGTWSYNAYHNVAPLSFFTLTSCSTHHAVKSGPHRASLHYQPLQLHTSSKFKLMSDNWSSFLIAWAFIFLPFVYITNSYLNKCSEVVVVSGSMVQWWNNAGLTATLATVHWQRQLRQLTNANLCIYVCSLKITTSDYNNSWK